MKMNQQQNSKQRYGGAQGQYNNATRSHKQHTYTKKDTQSHWRSLVSSRTKARWQRESFLEAPCGPCWISVRTSQWFCKHMCVRTSTAKRNNTHPQMVPKLFANLSETFSWKLFHYLCSIPGDPLGTVGSPRERGDRLPQISNVSHGHNVHRSGPRPMLPPRSILFGSLWAPIL